MPFEATPTSLPEVLVLQPRVFNDPRGFFFESFNARDFKAITGLDRTFVQDNQSYSVANVLRGLHYQIEHPQGKLVRVVQGAAFDVAIDMRRGSTNFGKWVGVVLSGENKRQLWIPEGFAHGFLVTSEFAEVSYKVTDYWHAEHERCLLWSDPEVGIRWPLSGAPPILATKDASAKGLGEAECFP